MSVSTISRAFNERRSIERERLQSPLEYFTGSADRAPSLTIVRDIMKHACAVLVS